MFFLRRLPFFRFLALAQVARMAGRHYQHLDATERRRFVELVRRGKGATDAEKAELRELTAKLDLRGLAGGAVGRLSPVPLPRRFTRSRY